MAKYYMSESQLERAFNKYKEHPDMKEALDNNWFIYLRENGFMTLNPTSLQPTTKRVLIKGRFVDKVVKPAVSQAKLKLIEKNYILYN